MCLFFCVKTVLKRKKLLRINRSATYSTAHFSHYPQSVWKPMWFRCIWLKPQYICRQYKENSLSSLLNHWKKNVMLYVMQDDVMQDPVCLCLWPNHIHINIVQTHSCGMIFECLTLFWNWKTMAKALWGVWAGIKDWGSSPGHWVVQFDL